MHSIVSLLSTIISCQNDKTQMEIILEASSCLLQKVKKQEGGHFQQKKKKRKAVTAR